MPSIEKADLTRGLPHVESAHALARKVRTFPPLPSATLRDRLLELCEIVPPERQDFYFKMTADLCSVSESYTKSRFVTAMRSDHPANDRRDCIGLLYAAVFNKTLAEGDEAVDKAREMDAGALLGVLAYDAGCAAAFTGGFCFLEPSFTASLTALAAKTSTAWKAAGFASKAKAVAFAAGFGIVSLAAASAVIGLAAAATDKVQDNEEARREAFTAELGKDLILLELITGRRYATVRVLPGSSDYRPSESYNPVRDGGAR